MEKILNEPLLIRAGISKNTYLDGVIDVLVDAKAPLFSLIPILLNVFKLESEFSFLYVEGNNSGKLNNPLLFIILFYLKFYYLLLF